MPQPKTKYGQSCYHVRIQRKEFDPQTGKEKFPPIEQYFTPDEFKRFQETPNGYTLVEVLHDPTKKAEPAEETEKPAEETEKPAEETEKPARSRK